MMICCGMLVQRGMLGVSVRKMKALIGKGRLVKVDRM